MRLAADTGGMPNKPLVSIRTDVAPVIAAERQRYVSEGAEQWAL
jgi:hypothetical protein